MPTAPSTIFYRAATTAEACCVPIPLETPLVDHWPWVGDVLLLAGEKNWQFFRKGNRFIGGLPVKTEKNRQWGYASKGNQ